MFASAFAASDGSKFEALPSAPSGLLLNGRGSLRGLGSLDLRMSGTTTGGLLRTAGSGDLHRLCTVNAGLRALDGPLEMCELPRERASGLRRAGSFDAMPLAARGSGLHRTGSLRMRNSVGSVDGLRPARSGSLPPRGRSSPRLKHGGGGGRGDAPPGGGSSPSRITPHGSIASLQALLAAAVASGDLVDEVSLCAWDAPGPAALPGQLTQERAG